MQILSAKRKKWYESIKSIKLFKPGTQQTRDKGNQNLIQVFVAK